MIHLTYEKAVVLAKNAVADRGEDYVYTNMNGDRNMCYYRHSEPGEPLVVGCMVGHIFHQLGIDLYAIPDLGVSKDMRKSLENLGFLTMDEDAFRFLKGLQRDQDDGIPWGKCIERNLM